MRIKDTGMDSFPGFGVLFGGFDILPMLNNDLSFEILCHTPPQSTMGSTENLTPKTKTLSSEPRLECCGHFERLRAEWRSHRSRRATWLQVPEDQLLV